MWISISDTDDRPIYLQITDGVRGAIVRGALGEHDALPSVRQLAGELGVNPNTVQQAYRELERAGVVYVRRGQGSFVAPGRAEEAERRRVLERIATLALREAYRHGLAPDDLLSAIERAAALGPTVTTEE